MNKVENTELVKARLTLIALSSLFVAVPQVIWSLVGYGGTFLIILDSLFIISGALLLMVGLFSPPPKILLQISRIFPPNSVVSHNLSKIEKILPFLSFLMVLYVLVPYGISSAEGFPTPPNWLLFSLGFITAVIVGFLIYMYIVERSGKQFRPLYHAIAFTILGIIWAFLFWYGTPKFPTDEFTLDYYSAHLLLIGKNPYFSLNTANVFLSGGFVTNGFPYSIATPYTTGGFVTNLTYPALAFIAFIPSVLLGVSPTAEMIPFYLALPLVIYVGYWKHNMKPLALIPVFLILLNPSYLIQIGLGYPDILWVLFTTLSFLLYKRPMTSGLMMGLSIAVKQIPWLLIPFFIIFIYRESGKTESIKWGLTTIAVFLLVNLAFIAMNPANFFTSMADPELQQLVGIGFGPSQFAFLNILPVPRLYFTYMVISIFIGSIIVYLAYYRNLRYAFLAFPILIFLFNYRLLLSYVLFWPIIALAIPVLMNKGAQKNDFKIKLPNLKKIAALRKIAVPAVMVVLLSAPIFYQYPGQAINHQFTLGNISVNNTQGHNVTGLTLTITMPDVNFSASDLQFRIIPDSSSGGMNGYLWKSHNFTKESTGIFLVTIVPMNESQDINWSGNYKVISYYGQNITSSAFTLNSGQIS